MELVEYTEFLITGLVKKPDLVSVKKIAEDDDEIVISVLVDNDDMGLVIGRSGNIIKAIRVLVQASSYANNAKKVKIDVDSI